MNKSSNKKSPGKKSARTTKRKRPSASTSKAHSGKRLIDRQPQIKEQAAVAHGMFLYTDDAWSLRYFDANDLHFKERELFG
jgi:hypothetical protein